MDAKRKETPREAQARQAAEIAAAQEAEKEQSVISPPHYMPFDGEGPECLDAIRAALGHEGYVAYLRGSVMAYTWRTTRKDDAPKDARKAAFMQARLVEELS